MGHVFIMNGKSFAVGKVSLCRICIHIMHIAFVLVNCYLANVLLHY